MLHQFNCQSHAPHALTQEQDPGILELLHLKQGISADLQFAYQPHRYKDDVASQVLHTTLTPLDGWIGGYVRLLFFNFSSAFNTITPPSLPGS